MKNTGYENRSAKVLDFVIGFLGAIVLVVAAGAATGMMQNVAGLVIGGVLALIAVIAAFVIRRHYIAIGLLTVLVLPLLVLGACISIFG